MDRLVKDEEDEKSEEVAGVGTKIGADVETENEEDDSKYVVNELFDAATDEEAADEEAAIENAGAVDNELDAEINDLEDADISNMGQNFYDFLGPNS